MGITPIRRWPDDKDHPREVTISIHTWRGYTAGASHWYVEVSIEGNPLVKIENGAIYHVSKSDDFDSRSFRHEGSFIDLNQALLWGKRTAEALVGQFPGSVIAWEDSDMKVMAEDIDRSIQLPALYWSDMGADRFLWWPIEEANGGAALEYAMRQEGKFDFPSPEVLRKAHSEKRKERSKR